MVNPLYLLHQLTLVLFVACIFFIVRKKYLIGCLLGLLLVVDLLLITEQFTLINPPEKFCQRGYFSVRNCPQKIVLTFQPMEGETTWNCYTKWGWRTGRNCPLDDCLNTQELCKQHNQ